MRYYVNTDEILSPKPESTYYKLPYFYSPIDIYNDIEDDNNSSFEEKQNKENNFEPIFMKEFDSERFNIEISNGIETQIKENQKPKNVQLFNPKLELPQVKTKYSSKPLNMLNNKRKRNDVEKDEIEKGKEEKEKEKDDLDEERRKYYEEYYIKGTKQKGRKKKRRISRK